MIYEVIKDNLTLSIDDTILFDKQAPEFQSLYHSNKLVEIKDEKGNVIDSYLTNNVEFDNCYIEVNEYGRLIICNKILEKDAAI